MTAVHFVIPDGIDDAARPTGGNVYDRRLSRGLTSIGWSVSEHAVPGFWSRPDASSFAALDHAVQEIPDQAVVLRMTAPLSYRIDAVGYPCSGLSKASNP